MSNLFDDSIDYTTPANDRPKKYALSDSTTLYLNDEQYAFMFEDYWKEKTRLKLETRCLVKAERGHLKRCTQKCENCPIYLDGKKPGATVSLDKLKDDFDFDIADDADFVEDIVQHDIAETVNKAIAQLDDPIDIQIILRFMQGSTDAKTAELLGLSRKAVNSRKLKAFAKLQKILENKL